MNCAVKQNMVSMRLYLVIAEKKEYNIISFLRNEFKHWKGCGRLKRTLLLLLILSTLLIPLLSYSAFAEGRAVLTIGDITDRTDSRIDGDDQLGLWQYMEDQLDVEIKFVYLTAEAYATGLSSGNLPDIVATNNNLATILENGVALDADPYLEEYVPNLLKGDARLAYDVFK